MTSPSATAQESLLTSPQDCPRVYWHRQLPPAGAEIMGEHVLEATSERVQGSLAHRDELWDRCYRDLLDNTRERFNQEIRRLGGDYAHVLDESIDSRHDSATGEAWLHGRFTYVLYAHGTAAPSERLPSCP
jgi:hypothetical protein